MNAIDRGRRQAFPGHSRALVALLGLACAAAPTFAAEIHLKDGEVLKVQSIGTATAEKVSFKMAGANQSRNAELVHRIYPSGDRNLDRALRLMRKGEDDLDKVVDILRRAVEKGDEGAQPCAQFFIAELLDQAGQTPQAVKEYDAVASKFKAHFYAPVAINRAAELTSGSAAVKRLERLASGEFGSVWKDSGKYGKARILLGQGKHAEAKPVFASLAGSADRSVADLSRCGEAHCNLLGGDKRGAERLFKQISGSKTAGGSALGYAWYGMGQLAKDDDSALLGYLKSALLYPSNPERAAAGKAAAELAVKHRLGGDRRLTGRLPVQDYGGDAPSTELMNRTLRFVSALMVQRLIPKVLKKASSSEKADLEFLGADAMKVVARARNDADLLAKYEKKLGELQKKYPNHGRAALAGVDAFIAAKDRALALIAQANEATEPDKAKALLEEGQKLFEGVLEPHKRSIAAQTRQIDQMLTKEESQDVPQAEVEQRRELEHRRDLGEFLLAEAYASYAKTFAEGDEKRKKNFEKARDGYDHYINERGSNVQWLWYSYLGRAEMYMELEQFEEAGYAFEELTFVEWPYPMPDDAEAKKAIMGLVKDVCIRAYHGVTRAMLLAGKGREAYERSQEIDENPNAQGWRDHPMGILLTFERAKALGGSGQGAKGAQELYRIIREAMKAPESEKIPGLGMSREGAGACRALSELSDLTGGEVYSAAIQYHVGVGYFLRQKPELAVAGYKGVLTGARTKRERERWVPKAVAEIGNLLFQQKRFLEAALAYETLFSEFPEHEAAQEAVRFAVSASKQAIEQFGEDPTDRSGTMVKFADEIERKAQSTGAADAEYAAKLILNDAKELHTKQRWLPAAQRYLEVPAETTDDKGRTRRISFYPNAVANAGYCYSKAYKDSGKEEHLTLARENLQLAARVAADANDRTSQSLACYYLGQLEVELKSPDAALAALAPFDDVLSGSAKFIVRARFEQAMAHVQLDQPDEAEERFAGIADKTDDDTFGAFAYTLGAKLRSLGNKRYEADNDPNTLREFKRKGAKYIGLWVGAGGLEGRRDVHYFWAGNALFEGGAYADAVKVYGGALEQFKRPKIKGPTDKKAAKSHASFDIAELNYGYALVHLGLADEDPKRLEEGIAQLTKVRNGMYVADRDGRKLAYGTYKDRTLKGPFEVSRQGRKTKTKVWFTVIEIDGKDVSFWDVAEPAGGNTEFRGVEGTDPTKPWQPNDTRVQSMPLKMDFLVVDGLERATWALYQKNQDKSFLAKDVAAASNELRYVLRSMDEASYAGIAANSQIEPLDLSLRDWRAQVVFLRIKLARESWGEVTGDIGMMKQLGKYKYAPDEIKAEIDEIEAAAKARTN